MDYDKVTDAMYGDLEDWLISKHSVTIRTLYTHLIESYLEERMGELNDRCHKQMVKHLLKKIIV